MNREQRNFIQFARREAEKVGHPFPLMAACEAALESGYGKSLLAIQGKNLFGSKQHAHPVYGTMNLPTREYRASDNKWETVMASWVDYPSYAACFADRLATLQRLSNVYPHYKNAIEAKDAKTYITEVSATWSTDPKRAEKVMQIYNQVAEVSA